MNLRTAATAVIGSALVGSILPAAVVVADESPSAVPIVLSGSGTTNPSKCFWHVLAELQSQIKRPTHLTYRAVGSGTGIKEFLGKDIDINGTITTTNEAYNDFGAGDIPISTEDKEAWNAKGIEFLQLPFVLSSVSFFHSIPGVPTGDNGLNMTACLLSRVFNRDITTWDHPDILDINPGLSVADDYPIFVGRRVLGSSSTYSITHYLYAQCPKNDKEPKGWPKEKTASKIEWHEDTNPCDGSGPMTDCIVENPGAIGYIDSAHGHEAMLNEIRLKNYDGTFLTSVEAGVEGIQRAAQDTSQDAGIPAKADGDFSEVAYYNMVSFVFRV